MVCELEYMNMGPANYRVCYATGLLNKQEVNMLDYNYWAIAQYTKDLIVD